ncbi:MAG TPA: EF-Tu/IF-2/RF-3 family GTPase [Candidatus Sulfotelmatobacter sp.]|nr:EF-Tu/IF-2/RF-3 family GTPase [Candidatus Sulfotelmatobacter sp.]
MGNLTVAVLGAQNYGNNLGKKGTSTDITLYNLKKGEDTVTFIEPSRYPERLAPLFYAVSLATKAVVVVDELNATLGECLVMLNCSNIDSGFFVLRNYLPKERVQPLIKDTLLEKFEFMEDNPVLLKEKLLNEAAQIKTSQSCTKSTGTVPVDHSFNVKGVGVVILGVVADGEISKHDNLRVFPGTKTAQIRSIQKHDDEFDCASQGDRVGLAVKNVELEDLERGTVLTSDPSIKSTRMLNAQASLVKYWQAPMKNEMVVHLGHWMQFIPARIEAISDNGGWRKPSLTLNLDKNLVYRPGDRAVISHLEGGKLRVAGTIDLL